MAQAGLFLRLIAWLYDLLLIGVPLFVFSVTLHGADLDALYTFLITFFVYATIAPCATDGYTLGKKLVRIRIIVYRKNKLLAMVIRHILAVILYALSCGLVLFISMIMICVRADQRSLHDVLANTVVVQE